ncbi:tRNA (adenosine(37)-N6)-threonylcarbamoyltransferase complex ATPase subunit type 1 TsaE [Fictibacillus sp. b24]|uniref:tRNA (adenosine(37)-N6)-threonylcarbamoyltransferase complex ATPase subunit type 1 TsaE n=1 Tax=Fictibacillus sp. b24 TaxID=3055863 RepID=UPI0025A270F0|nr:tRNA (adenosine(37)-N6)-threonylcarbamoyltransferase complex ATPase subunit type 1 TsaE [Fictibacillus sp. b24]MDM5318259.1 tRNA (adenosine(37)-N6)-threonylcarbamoyltransferase complex ATPase subunit type 1 TsaE [Fictibacillus sp. b24]
MITYHYKTKSAEETMSFAEKLGSILQKGDVLTLAGDLGAGKTTFTKGLAKGLGITRTVNSPTFTIIKEYKGRLPLYHMDVYRLEDSDEDLGFEEYFSGDGVCVVEWAVFIEEYLPEERLELVISNKGDEEREIQVTPIGNRYEERVKEIM